MLTGEDILKLQQTVRRMPVAEHVYALCGEAGAGDAAEDAGGAGLLQEVADVGRRAAGDVIAVTVARRRGWPVRQPSPKKSPFSWRATTASLPFSETTVTLHLPSMM